MSFILQNSEIDLLDMQYVIQHCKNACSDCSPFRSAVNMEDVITAYDFYKLINSQNVQLPENSNFPYEEMRKFNQAVTGSKNMLTCDEMNILTENHHLKDKNLLQQQNTHSMSDTKMDFFSIYGSTQKNLGVPISNKYNLELYDELAFEDFCDKNNEIFIHSENADKSFICQTLSQKFALLVNRNVPDKHKNETSNQDTPINNSIIIKDQKNFKNSEHVINIHSFATDKLNNKVSVDKSTQKKNTILDDAEIMVKPLKKARRSKLISKTFHAPSNISYTRLLALKRKNNILKKLRQKIKNCDCTKIQISPTSLNFSNLKFFTRSKTQEYDLKSPNYPSLTNLSNFKSSCWNDVAKLNTVSSCVQYVLNDHVQENSSEKISSHTSEDILNLDIQEKNNLFLENKVFSYNLNEIQVNIHSSNFKNSTLTKNCYKSRKVYKSSSSLSEDSGSESEKSFERRKMNASRNPLSVNLLKPINITRKRKAPHLEEEFSQDRSSFSTLSSCNSKLDSSLNGSYLPIQDLQTLTVPQAENIGDQNLSSLIEVSPKGTLKEVLTSIKMMCSRNEIQTAIFITNNYMPVSIPNAKEEIFVTLFLEIMNTFRTSTLKIAEETYDRTFDSLFKMLCENNLFTSNVCSLIVTECFSCEIGLQFTFDVLEKCFCAQIPMLVGAVTAYSKFLSDNGDIVQVLAFYDFVENVCKMNFPNELLHKLLYFCVCEFQKISLLEFNQICSILCMHKYEELDSDYVEPFFKVCIENEFWNQIAIIFQTCVEKNNFKMIHNLHQALSFPLEEAGDNYEKFTASVCDSPTKSLNVLALCGQIGICLLLETANKKKRNSALTILFVFHKYNINYFELLPAIINDKFLNSLLERKDVLVSKDALFTTVIEICLHFKRAKDAFNIFKNFIGILHTENFEKKITMLKQHYLILLKIAKLLIINDPFQEGLQALHILLSVEEQGLSFDTLKDHIKDISLVYNQYLGKLLNEGKLEAALELCERKYGACKDKLPINPLVRRGFIVSCLNNGMTEKAVKLFRIAYIKKCYSIQQPDHNSCPPTLSITTSWSTEEIKFILELFFEILHPFLLLKDNVKKKWFALRFKYKVQNTQNSWVKCLTSITCDIESSIKRTKEALQKIDSTLICNEAQFIGSNSSKKGLEIPAEIFHSYWKNKFCPVMNTVMNGKFMISDKSHISFGTNEPERKNEDFAKIAQFLKAKVLLKYKDMTQELHQQKADNLAVIFIRGNIQLNRLDRRGMKLLSEFAEKNV